MPTCRCSHASTVHVELYDIAKKQIGCCLLCLCEEFAPFQVEEVVEETPR